MISLSKSSFFTVLSGMQYLLTRFKKLKNNRLTCLIMLDIKSKNVEILLYSYSTNE
jgi:hypothetical protein